jgi:hypothetical protein
VHSVARHSNASTALFLQRRVWRDWILPEPKLLSRGAISGSHEVLHVRPVVAGMICSVDLMFCPRWGVWGRNDESSAVPWAW